MAGITISLKSGSTELENYILTYIQDKHICTGIGFLNVTFSSNVPVLSPGDELVLKESGNTVGTFYVNSFTKEKGKGYIAVCQDASKWLQAYFIAEQYDTSMLSSRYWIGWVLNQAQISHNFTTADNGYVMSEFDKIGLANGYDTVVTLCQQSGWYFYFDENN
jgi:hypothetical protein